MVTLQFAFHVDWKKLLAGQYLRTGGLEMVVDYLYAVQLAICKALAQFHCQVNALAYVGMVHKGAMFANGIVAQFARFLSHLTAYGVDVDAVGPKLCRVFFHGMLHELNDVGIETAAQRRVAADDHQCYTLQRTLRVVNGLSLSLSG